ncbi:zf-HC2 domain-containing protein [uncultured Friedmanniella sp.]|uniref:zf-HC2 domain-containing protein n=1 Tax=uncultured Friedmanniella sp. TaxID=335381 RepID=UPI0035CAF905
MRRGRTRRAPCADLAENRSALVDGALDPERRERLLVHLVHCTSCRAEVAELRRLRDTLRMPTGGEAPRELAQRLVLIAGAEATAPLWSRPFRRTRPGSLTSRRRTLRLRRTAAAVAVGATVAGVSVVGYLAAPADTLTAVADPGSEARTEFASMLAQLPLTNDALGAVMSTRVAALSTATGSTQTGTAQTGTAQTGTTQTGTAAPGTAGTGLPDVGPTVGTRALDAAAAQATLARAAVAAETVGYAGRQVYVAASGSTPVRATVEVEAVAGEGTWSRVLDPAGQVVGSGYAKATSVNRLNDSHLVSLLESHYSLAAWTGAEAAGRSATMVEARRAGQLAARWWVDDATGIVLAQQGFDDTGRQVMQVAFTSVELRPHGLAAPDPAQPAEPAQLKLPTTDTVLTLSAAPALSRQGWFCADELARLSLVRLRSSSGTPAALHLVYSDGVATVSVFEQQGRLATAPSGSAWDGALGAYVQDGTSSLATWQSDGTVFTVVTDGSAELLASAVSALPHAPLPERTTMKRIRAGWGQILADVWGQ